MAVWSVPKLETELLEYFEPVLDGVGTILGGCVIIYTLNYVLVCMRLEMARDFGFTKWNRCLISGLPTDSPLLGLGLLKIAHVCIGWTKTSMCLLHEILLG